MNHVEVCVHAEVDSGELASMITGAVPSGAWESPGIVHLYWPEDLWDTGLLAELRSILERLGIPDRPGLITTSTVPDQDWNQAWARSLCPIRVGNGIVIRQSWNSLEGPAAAAAVELVIDPRRAFGSGYHATTQLLLEWLEEEIRGGERVLDVGTGSGILAMAALRLGAASALGIDDDPVAVECAREYAAINGFGQELELRVAGIPDLDRDVYDIVLANLDGRTLLRFAPRLIRLIRPGGRLFLSGLQFDDCEDIAGALSGVGAIVARRDRDEWLALMVATATALPGGIGDTQQT